MRKIFVGASLLLVMVFASSCGTAKKAAIAAANAATAQNGMVEETIPLSGAKYHSDAEYYRAVQNGVSTDVSVAQKIAMQNCRQSLAEAISSDLQEVVENYVKSQNTQSANENMEQYQELAYSVTKQKLADVQVVEEKMYREPNGNHRYYVCLQIPKASLEKALEKAVEDAVVKDEQLELEFNREEFKKIFEAKMAEFSETK